MPSRAWVVVLALVGIGIVALLAMAIANELNDGFDQAITDAVRADALDGLLSPLRVVTELGSTGAVTIVAAATFLVGVVIGRWHHGAAGAITIGLASLAVEGLKDVVARARPDAADPLVVEPGFSFPSGHATLSLVAYGVLAVLITRSWLAPGVRVPIVVALGVVVLLVGVSRIWLGVHYPTDVLGGWTAGAVIVLVYASLTRGALPGPAAGAVDADPAAPRSDRPAPG